MRVLVCGGRDYGQTQIERNLVVDTLDAEHIYGGRIDPLIEGCARGADHLAELWANSRGVPIEHYPADWYPNNDRMRDRSAGPKRNYRMLVEGKPDLVIAFPGGRGTANMIEQATRAGVPVRVIE